MRISSGLIAATAAVVGHVAHAASAEDWKTRSIYQCVSSTAEGVRALEASRLCCAPLAYPAESSRTVSRRQVTLLPHGPLHSPQNATHAIRHGVVVLGGLSSTS